MARRNAKIAPARNAASSEKVGRAKGKRTCASDNPRWEFPSESATGLRLTIRQRYLSHLVLQPAALIGRSWFRPQANNDQLGGYLSPASPTLHVLTLSPFLVTTPNADPSIIPDAPVPRAGRKRDIGAVYLTFLALTRTISAASRIPSLYRTCTFFPHSITSCVATLLCLHLGANPDHEIRHVPT